MTRGARASSMPMFTRSPAVLRVRDEEETHLGEVAGQRLHVGGGFRSLDPEDLPE